MQGIINKIRVSFYILAEMLLRVVIHPRVKARLFALLGARIGKNVRIHEAKFIHPLEGFGNLVLDDEAYIGPQAVIDLSGKVTIGKRTSISPGCVILTHADPGSFFENRLAKKYPRKVRGVTVGNDCWLGAGAIVLCDVSIGNGSIIGAGAMVSKDVGDNVMYLNERKGIEKAIDI